MRRIACVFLILIIFVFSGCEVHTEIVKQDVQIIDELKAILNELDDEAARNTVQEFLGSQGEIDRTFFTIDNKYYLVDIYNEEIAYFKQEPFSFQMECILDYASYVCYKSTYSKRCKNGSVKIHYLTVFTEVDEEGELIFPLHLYAYNRVIEKRTGMLETYTEPDFYNSFIEIGSKY